MKFVPCLVKLEDSRLVFVETTVAIGPPEMQIDEDVLEIECQVAAID